MNGSRAIVMVSGGMMLVFVALQPPPRYKRAWAAGVIFLGLSFLADVAPDVAAPASVLVLLALAYQQRGSLGQLLGNVSAKTLPPGAPTGVKGPQGAAGSKPTTNVPGSQVPGMVGPIGAP